MVGYIGYEQLDNTRLGMVSMPEKYSYRLQDRVPTVSHVTSNQLLYLDPGNTSSYPGSGTTWFDISGNSNNFTLYNSPTKLANSFSFNGTNQYANIGSSSLDLDPGGTRTLEVWFKLNSTNQTAGIFGDQMSSTGCLSFGTGEVVYWNWDDGYLSTNTLFNAEGWYQVVAVLESSYFVTFYVNGQLDMAKTQTSDTASPGNSTWSIARQNRDFSGDLRYLNGEIGIVRQYSSALSAAEVLQNFNANKGVYGLY